MKLRNKRTGEIIEFDAILPVKDVVGDSVAHLEYGSLAELNSEWEDAPEEPEGYYYINTHLHSVDYVDNTYENKGKDQEIGNCFLSREEAEKALEKLKAWKRLKDNGFKIKRWYLPTEGGARVIIEANCVPNIVEELDLLFGGEE